MILRYTIRKKYNIPEECCTCTGVDGLEDCCCAYWCMCCTLSQVARHEYADVEAGGADQGVDLGHAAGAGADHEHGLGHV